MTPHTEYIYRLISKGYNTPRKLMAATSSVRGTISNQLMYLETQGMIERVKPGLYKCL